MCGWVDKFESKKILSKHTNMGANFKDLIESDLLVKTDLKSELSFER
jgi:hypothetical protein